jgi:putative hydrolase of HD superfamily
MEADPNMEADQERFRKQLDFILEIDKEKNILRQTHLTGHGRREDDADHSWHLAVMTWILREYSNQEIDIVRTILMVLIHDIVEIDAGDTYAYDAEAKKTEAARETRAAERIFGLLPEDQGRMLREIWEEFDAYETPEARFAHVMDNFQPMLLNDSNGGGDWKEHGVSQAQVRKRNAKTGTGSEEIWSYMQEILAENIRKGSLKP